MVSGSGGVVDSSFKGLEIYFLRIEIWNVGFILQCLGTSSLYVTGLICLLILYGPAYFTESFLHFEVFLRSQVDNHTFSPGLNVGASLLIRYMQLL